MRFSTPHPPMASSEVGDVLCQVSSSLFCTRPFGECRLTSGGTFGGGGVRIVGI